MDEFKIFKNEAEVYYGGRIYNMPEWPSYITGMVDAFEFVKTILVECIKTEGGKFGTGNQ